MQILWLCASKLDRGAIIAMILPALCEIWGRFIHGPADFRPLRDQGLDGASPLVDASVSPAVVTASLRLPGRLRGRAPAGYTSFPVKRTPLRGDLWSVPAHPPRVTCVRPLGCDGHPCAHPLVSSQSHGFSSTKACWRFRRKPQRGQRPQMQASAGRLHRRLMA